MKQVGEVRIEPDRITTPEGQYPLNPNSAVWIRKIQRQQYTKKLIGLGLFLALPVAPILFPVAAGGLLAHESYEVVVNTDGVEYVVYQFSRIFSVLYNEQRAVELKDAIAEVIAEARASNGGESKQS
jgi:hypothetical protein